MVGSPNFVRFVYDGDGSTFGVKGPSGSRHIENTFVLLLPVAEPRHGADGVRRPLDYDAFINAGIPAGGLHRR